ncbi:hypothetical protein AWQ21_07755 [Picosynechococcus sp. PCC 7003]|uniref:hypothetical protein n=1 Tax=Picosynechococcus sp. PCC 7003 TaxID=374981 RepID=UPI0008107F15|nr:hypothetical protein [Picosynechococcus sp. PCC 7003]ANV84286.1 hypothetical protein AWQ21_07755 [Picosynechococcus sp. PCC 7003]
MNVIVNIPDDVIQKLEAQNQPLQTLLLQALNEYLEKRSPTTTKTWELCGTFEVTNPNSWELADQTGTTNYAENLDRDLY